MSLGLSLTCNSPPSPHETLDVFIDVLAKWISEMSESVEQESVLPVSIVTV